MFLSRKFDAKGNCKAEFITFKDLSEYDYT